MKTLRRWVFERGLTEYEKNNPKHIWFYGISKKPNLQLMDFIKCRKIGLYTVIYSIGRTGYTSRYYFDGNSFYYLKETNYQNKKYNEYIIRNFKKEYQNISQKEYFDIGNTPIKFLNKKAILSACNFLKLRVKLTNEDYTHKFYNCKNYFDFRHHYFYMYKSN